jgi:hypothetical protein
LLWNLQRLNDGQKLNVGRIKINLVISFKSLCQSVIFSVWLVRICWVVVGLVCDLVLQFGALGGSAQKGASVSFSSHSK